MKIKFIAPIFNLELETVKNKGIDIFSGIRISNASSIENSVLKTDLVQATLGVHSIREIQKNTYVTFDYNLEHITSKSEMDEIGNSIAFMLLRLVEEFLFELWKVTDHSAYLRDGYLIAYTKEIEDGYTFKASLTTINSKSNPYDTNYKVNDEFFSRAIKFFKPESILSLIHEEYDWKKASDDNLFRNKSITRVDRASYFVLFARSKEMISLKIFAYCSALECLFTSGNSEVNHKIAERVAVILGSSKEERQQLYNTIKKAYGIRSTVVHGSSFKNPNDYLVELSVQLDGILRRLLSNNHEFLGISEDKFEIYFTDKLFDY